jgi:hypothetical protein
LCHTIDKNVDPAVPFVLLCVRIERRLVRFETSATQ